MLTYRLYYLNRRNRIVGVQIVEAKDDAEAMNLAQATHMKAGFGHEIWQEGRLVDAQAPDPTPIA